MVAALELELCPLFECKLELNTSRSRAGARCAPFCLDPFQLKLPCTEEHRGNEECTCSAVYLQEPDRVLPRRVVTGFILFTSMHFGLFALPVRP